MHPILARYTRLALYLAAWLPIAGMLVYLLGMSGHMNWAEAAAIIVPLAAFDGLGHRIGYGAGHYDFTLAHLRKLKHVIAIGLAFAAQEIVAVPALPHDVALDYVLTETDMLDFRS